MSRVDAFVDAVVDEAMRGWLRERMARRDADRAFDFNECTRHDLSVRPAACREGIALQQALAQRRRIGLPTSPGDWLRLNRLRGQCAEQQTLRGLCLGRGRFEIFNQAQVRPGDPRSPRLDIGGFRTPRSGRRALRSGLETKHLHLPSFVDPSTGTLAVRRLQDRVERDAGQVRAQQSAVMRPGARAGLPRRIRLLYHLGGLGTVRRLEARLGIAPQRSDMSARPMPAAALAAAQVIRATAARSGVAAFVIGARL